MPTGLNDKRLMAFVGDVQQSRLLLASVDQDKVSGNEVAVSE